MVKKKKQHSGNGALVIAIVLVMIMGIMWYFSDRESSLLEPPMSSPPENEVIHDGAIQDDFEAPPVVDQNPEPEPETQEPDLLEIDNAEPEPDNEPPSEGGDYSGIEDTLSSWSFRRNEENKPVEVYTTFDVTPFDTYYADFTEEKVIYLTFDEGYEMGFTESILDTLSEYEVPAAFFVTEPYIKNNVDLVKRMVEEGHVVGNHSSTHPSMPGLSDERIQNEVLKPAVTMLELTGHTMDPFFRPPMGEYSKRTLQITKDLGYKTVFWTLAYVDWLVDDQPGADAALQHVLDYHHPGCIMLLHAVSSSNTEALADIIVALRDQGYRFGRLYELN